MADILGDGVISRHGSKALRSRRNLDFRGRLAAGAGQGDGQLCRSWRAELEKYCSSGARLLVGPSAEGSFRARSGETTRAAGKPSIAVLPFTNMSGDPEQEYFSDGISEDVITDLSKIAGLMVISRNSSFTYKGRPVDTRAVGRDLGVRSVLEGSVRRAGNRVRVTAQLIDAASGGHLWAERYDRDLTDFFAVQDDVTRRIVEALKLALSPAEKTRIADSGTRNIDAYDCFLRGREFLLGETKNRDKFEQSITFFMRALELDSNYSRAYAGLGWATYTITKIVGVMISISRWRLPKVMRIRRSKPTRTNRLGELWRRWLRRSKKTSPKRSLRQISRYP